MMKRARQTSLALDPPKPTAREEAGRWRYYSVGGWPEYSQFIDPRTVPLCTGHDHGPVDPELMRSLVKKCLWEPFFRGRCLAAQWRGHPAGAACLTYGSTSADALTFGLWIAS